MNQLHPGVDFTSTVGPPFDKEDYDQNAYAAILQRLHIPPWPAVKPFSDTTAAPVPSSSHQVLGPVPWSTYERDGERDTGEGGFHAAFSCLAPLSHPHSVLSLPCAVALVRGSFPPVCCFLRCANADAYLDHESAGDIHIHIADTMKKLDIRDQPWRYHGKASTHHLFLTLNAVRREDQRHLEANMLERIKRSQRPQYWHVPEWEISIANEGLQSIDYSIWPDDQLANELIDGYFEHANQDLPLLNRIIFREQYDSQMYRTNHHFAKVCLLVLANGARFVDDPRLYWSVEEASSEAGKERLRNDVDGTLKFSVGWKYLREVLRMGKSIMQSPNLYDFQCEVLVCAFLNGSAVPHLTWLVSGAGLRSAQEIGIHVRSILRHADPIERALYNRAFWCLYHIDRINCAGIGRSVALQDTDFDADYPIAVDDEYWDTGNPETDFKQPESAGVPSITAFIHILKLDHIISAALRTIYAINKSIENPGDQRTIVVELDSALNSWADGVPDGLRWDPTRSDSRLFKQSAGLYAHYYYCQILVHRPFISTPNQSRDIGLPSLAICTNAARSICNILDAVVRRGRQSGSLPGHAISPNFILPAWIAFAVLLISIYTGKQQVSERQRAINDTKKCIAAMREIESVWRQAGKLTDFMVQMASDEIPVEKPPAQGTKRSISPTEGEGVILANEKPARIPTPPPIFGLGPCPGVQEATYQPNEEFFDSTLFDTLFGSLGDLPLFGFENGSAEDQMWTQVFQS